MPLIHDNMKLVAEKTDFPWLVMNENTLTYIRMRQYWDIYKVGSRYFRKLFDLSKHNSEANESPFIYKITTIWEIHTRKDI